MVLQAQLYARSPHSRLRQTAPQGLQQEDLGSVSGSVKSDRFDYVEPVDTTSSMSTPTSSNYWDNDPFAKDSLGDTVIHLDKVRIGSVIRKCTLLTPHFDLRFSN